MVSPWSRRSATTIIGEDGEEGRIVMTKPDRRVRRTQELLQQALVGLLGERRYEAITIQEIADRANVGCTTFYLHYPSKDDLFIRCHEAIVGQFRFGPHHPLSREELLAPDAPAATIAAYRHLAEVRTLVYRLFQGKDGAVLLRRLRDGRAREIAANLRRVFPDANSAIPLEMLANYLAGAQIALMHWWLEQHQSHSPEVLAQTFHRLQRAAVREALGLEAGE
jgi:AcrR family transcriptional regulator